MRTRTSARNQSRLFTALAGDKASIPTTYCCQCRHWTGNDWYVNECRPRNVQMRGDTRGRTCFEQREAGR